MLPMNTNNQPLAPVSIRLLSVPQCFNESRLPGVRLEEVSLNILPRSLNHCRLPIQQQVGLGLHKILM
jgi:hypothetical protein